MSPNTVILELSCQCGAPVEDVWAVLTNIHAFSDVLSGVSRIEALTPGGYRVGSRWRETRTMLGRARTEEMWVTVAEPTRRTVVEADSGGTRVLTEFILDRIDDDLTHISFTFTGAPVDATGIKAQLWRMLAPIGMKATTKMMASDLRDIADAAEHRNHTIPSRPSGGH